MSDLRIFSYLPNPRLYKATIAARISGAEVEIVSIFEANSIMRAAVRDLQRYSLVGGCMTPEFQAEMADEVRSFAFSLDRA